METTMAIAAAIIALCVWCMYRVSKRARQTYDLADNVEMEMRRAARTKEDAERVFDMLLEVQRLAFERNTYGRKNQLLAMWEDKFEGLYNVEVKNRVKTYWFADDVHENKQIK